MTAGARRLRSWARTVASLGPAEPGAADHLVAVRATVLAVARALPDTGVEARLLVDGDARGVEDLAAALPDPPGGWADPLLPGLVHEQVVGLERRAARGAWYTPESVVRGLVALATEVELPDRAVDPTCGGGAFLVALLDRFVDAGLEPVEAIGRIAGLDIDPGAVWTSRWSVALWAAGHGVDLDPGGLPVVVGDALDPGRSSWSSWSSWASVVVDGQPPVGGRTLVIGNPPFASPLRSGRIPARAEAFREANRELLGPYSDLAAIHLLAAIESVGPGGVVALIQPQSVLSGRDTAELRRHCGRAAPLQALWACREAVFDAGVRACAVVVRPGGEPPERLRLAAGPSVEVVEGGEAWPPADGRWGAPAAQALGAPRLPAGLRPDAVAVIPDRPRPPSLGDLVSATAGFRDEYYGLVAACHEWDPRRGEEPNRLISVGSVDPLTLDWGVEGRRFGGRQWTRPVIDLDALEPPVRAWVEQRLEPKVVLATQSKVLEPVVDRAGRLVPATPLISVSADPADLDRVAAVLLAPPVVAWAWQRWFGTALSVDALKLAARQVLELPLPSDRASWDEAATRVSDADGVDPATAASVVEEVARLMTVAYGADDAVLAWWYDRRAGRRRGRRGPGGRGGPIGPGL